MKYWVKPDIENRDIGPERGNPGKGLLSCCRLAHDHEVGFDIKKVTQAAPDDVMIVQYENRCGHCAGVRDRFLSHHCP